MKGSVGLPQQPGIFNLVVASELENAAARVRTCSVGSYYDIQQSLGKRIRAFDPACSGV